jgi:hypothetical protein
MQATEQLGVLAAINRGFSGGRSYNELHQELLRIVNEE